METLGERSRVAITAAAAAVGLEARTGEMLSIFDRMSASWAGRGFRQRVYTMNTTDGSHLELSVPLAGRRELRLGVEPQQKPFGHKASFAAGREVLAAISELPSVSLAPIEAAVRAFEPRRDVAPGFGIAFGVGFREGAPPQFKVYFNTAFAVHNGTTWADVIEPAVGREVIARVQEALGPDGDVGIISYDLIEGAESRVKLYAAHARPGSRDAATDVAAAVRVGALGTHSVAGDVEAFFRHFAPEASDPSSGVPVFGASTLHVLEGRIDRVTTNIQLMPFGSGKVPPDSELLRRLEAFSQEVGIAGVAPLPALLDALEAVRGEPASALTFLSVQREGAGPRLTAYVSPRLHDSWGAT